MCYIVMCSQSLRRMKTASYLLLPTALRSPITASAAVVPSRSPDNAAVASVDLEKYVDRVHGSSFYMRYQLNFPSTELVPMIAAMQLYPSEAFCLKDLTDPSNSPWLSARHDVVLMAGRDTLERFMCWDR